MALSWVMCVWGHAVSVYVMAQTVRQGHFLRVSDVSPLTPHIHEYSLGLPKCAARCLETPQCESIGTNTDGVLCRLYDSCPLRPGSNHSGWRFYSPCKCRADFIRVDGWILGFRGVPHINSSMYDVYTTSGLSHDTCADNIPHDCLSLQSSSGSCDRHFRSKILDMWDRADVTEVRLLLYKDSLVVGNVTFGAAGYSMTSWMSDSNFISSSTWPDVSKANINYCSFEGHPITSRRLYLNNKFSGCGGDAGWIMIIDNLEKLICSYETGVTSYPVIFYGIGGATKWSNSSSRGEADSIAVLVKAAV